MVDVDAIADELYALPPEQFIGKRDEVARDTKPADANAAKAIRALRKPSTAAWLLNQLVRTDNDDVIGLLDLGAALRQAQSRLEGAQLRDLAKQRRQAVNALVRQARRFAGERGKPASEAVAREVEQTLEAALTSPDAAKAVQTGRLSAGLTPDAGFEPAAPHLRVVADDRVRVDVVRGDVVGGDVVRKKQQSQAGRRAAANAAAAQLKRAEQAAEQAARELEAAITTRDAAARRVATLSDEITELTNRLRALDEELTEAKRAERQAAKALATAERAARRADLARDAASPEATKV